jgi:hypothetical protein
MDIGKAFTFVFEDERWLTKVLIGGLLIWIPIVNFAVFGYMLKVAQNVAQGNPRPLPEWSDFGDLFMRGLYYFVITIVYQIPTILLGCVVGGIVGGLGAAASESSDSAAGGVAAIALCLYPLLLVVAISLSIVTYAAVARYVATNTLSEAFKFGDVFGFVRKSIGSWLILILVAILAGIVGQLGIIACGVGVLFTLFYAYVVQGHALGQTIVKEGLMGGVNPYSTQSIPPTTYQ